MLKDIIRMFEQSERPTSLSEMARTLGVQESALEGMLDTLVRKGKLVEVGAEAGCASGSCGSRCGACHCGPAPAQPKSYRLVRKD